MANNLKADPITGTRSTWSGMDPKLRREIDRLLITREMTIKEMAKKYGIPDQTMQRRRMALMEASNDLAMSKSEKIRSQARLTLEWAQDKAKETYEAAKGRKEVLKAKGGAALVQKVQEVVEATGEVVERDEVVTAAAPDLETMVQSIRIMHELARTYGEAEGVIGKVREIREQAKVQKELAAAGIGIGGMGMGGLLGPGGSVVQTLNVLVMPKDPGVEEEQRRMLGSGGSEGSGGGAGEGEMEDMSDLRGLQDLGQMAQEWGVGGHQSSDESVVLDAEIVD